MQTLKIAGTALAATLIAAAALTQSVWAHAHYARSQPSPGQVLGSAPDKIEIFTDSDMRKAPGGDIITVTGPDGARVDDGNTIVDDSNRQHFSVGLKPGLGNGRYLVSFQTLSDVDGDIDHGQFAFYVGPGPAPDQQRLDSALTLTDTPPPDTGTPVKPSGASRGIIIGAAVGAMVLVLLAGGATLLVLRRPSQA
jgi:copper resistance protein C